VKNGGYDEVEKLVFNLVMAASMSNFDFSLYNSLNISSKNIKLPLARSKGFFFKLR